MKLKLNEKEIDLQKYYSRLFPKVRAYVIQNSGNKDDAKDIFQEALLATCINVSEGKFIGNETNLEAYIYQISKYKWLDQLTSKHKKNVRLQNDLHSKFINEDTYTEINTSSLLNAVSQLGDVCKKLLQLFYFEKVSLKKIGEQLGYNTAVTKTKKYRCMMKLREIYLKNNDDDRA